MRRLPRPPDGEPEAFLLNMAKNREQLEKEAEELNIDASQYDTKAKLEAAIKEVKGLPSDKEQKEDKKKKSEKVAGCEACENTGLTKGLPSSEATICIECNGSPFEPKEEKE